MVRLILVTLALLASSCAIAPAKKVSKAKFLVGSDIQGVKLSSIEADLTRSHAPSTFAAYTASALLITEPYIRVYETEIGRRSLEDQSVINKRITGRLAKETDDKTCFLVTLSSSAGTNYGVDVASFKSWKGKLKLADKIVALKFADEGKSERLQASGTQMSVLGQQGVAYIENVQRSSTLACTNSKIDPTQTLTLVLIPQFGNEKTKNIEMTWN